jgi:hypothetical protein
MKTMVNMIKIVTVITFTDNYRHNYQRRLVKVITSILLCTFLNISLNASMLLVDNGGRTA